MRCSPEWGPLLCCKIGGSWMHSYLTIALISLAPAANWESSYGHAQQQAISQQKPLAVVFGSGADGWTKIVRTNSPTPQINNLLAEHYVCVYVDTDTTYGKDLARAFQIGGGVGMVISDRSGGSQAFWHQGDMTNDHLIQYLTKYADSRVVVTHTETTSPARTSR